MAVNYNDGKWHGWNGGECPVHPETVVRVVCVASKDDTWDIDRQAGLVNWEHGVDDVDGTVVAFCVIKEHREPREFWLWGENKRPMFVMDSPDKRFPNAIHVREVLE